MVASKVTRGALAALALLLSAACGDDDPAEPEADAGIETMLLTVGEQMVTVQAGGGFTGELGPLPFGTIPVTASFLFEGGAPATGITPDRYTFEVITPDTLAVDWTGGTGFTGTLTTMAGGSYALTFRLRDTRDSGTEIFLARTLEVDVGIATARIIVGGDTLRIPEDSELPSTVDELPVGPVPVQVAFLDAGDAPSPLVTAEAFTLTVTSSDTNIIAWTEEGPFTGTLRGVAPGVATVSFTLRSQVNGALVFRHLITAIVGAAG